MEEGAPEGGMIVHGFGSRIKARWSSIPLTKVFSESQMYLVVVHYLPPCRTRQGLKVQLLTRLSRHRLNHGADLTIPSKLITPLDLSRHLCTHNDPLSAVQLGLDELDNVLKLG
jgi:hypothetical protein